MSLLRRKRKYQKKKKIDWGIEPETIRLIVSIALIVLVLIFLLSLFGAGGVLGGYLAYAARALFGYLSYLFLLVILFLAIILLMPQKFQVKGVSILGLFFLTIFLAAFFHLFVNKEMAFEIAKQGRGGGLLGFLFSSLFSRLLSFWGAFLFILGILLISFVMAFQPLLPRFWERFRLWLSREKASSSANQPNVPVLTMTHQRTPETIGERLTPSTEGYHLPPYDLLEPTTSNAVPGDVNRNISIIAKTLSHFGISVTMGEVSYGPTVTQYTLKPAEGVKLSQITARSNDLALALAAHPIRIEAPIPGKALVGIEVPNQKRATVALREILLDKAWREHNCKLPIVLGRDVAGAPVIVNLEKMPHLLVAGATGSGKTIFLNCLILSLLFAKTPEELKFILIDPKRVEFNAYNNLPHLLAPVVFDLDKTISTLKWTVAEMEHRYKIFQEVNKRDIEVYNQSQKEKMPYIVLIIDELADLMALAASEIEAQIVRIAQMARATGIHLVLATQRPSVDVITGLIKANITARIAFTVPSQVDSRTILDVTGAEKLLGSGDMLYQGSDIAKPRRIQGVWVKEKEVKRVTEFIKSQVPEVRYDEQITAYKPEPKLGREGPDDELYQQAKEIVLDAQFASATLLQRKLRIGYPRAARLLEFLEQEGVIGPQSGSKPRAVLAKKEQEEKGGDDGY